MQEPVAQSGPVIPVTSDGHPQLYWKERTLCKAFDISRQLLWQKISDGSFPPPEKLRVAHGEKGRTNRWSVRLILAWLDAGSPPYTQWTASVNTQG